MPYNKAKGRAARKIYRYYKRYKRNKKANPKKAMNPVLTTIQKTSSLVPIASSTVPAFEGGTLVFRLSDSILNVGNFTRLFKFYRLLGVKVTFIPLYRGFTGAPAGETQPQMLIAGNMMTSITRDSNDLTATSVWTQVDQAEQVSNLRKKYLSPQTGNRSVHVVKFRPKLNNWVRTQAGSNNSTVTIAKGNPWISTQTPGQEYFGLKWGWELQSNGFPAHDIEIRVSYIWQFKGVL